MNRSADGATLVRSRLRVIAKGCPVRSSVRSGCSLTIGARSPGGEPSAAVEPSPAVEPTAAWDASGGADGEGIAGSLAVTDGRLRGRSWLVALDSATGPGTDSGCGSASGGPTGAARSAGKAAGTAAFLTKPSIALGSQPAHRLT